jgi:Tfp pilus assembly protein PilN
MKAVNLIPREQRKGASKLAGRSSGGALMVLAMIAALVGLATMYGSAHHRISSQSGEAALLSSQTRAIQARAGRLAPYASFVSMAEQRMRTVSQLVESRFDWSHTLHELGRVLPAGTSLDSLHGAVGSTGPVTGSSPSTATSSSSAASSSSSTAASTVATSSTPPGSTPVFTLSGCATSQSEVAQTLQRLRLMDGASEVQLQSSSKSSSGGGTSNSGCPSGDPIFTVQVSFAALPPAPALSAPTGTTPASTGAAHGHGVAEQVSARGKVASR